MAEPSPSESVTDEAGAGGFVDGGFGFGFVAGGFGLVAGGLVAFAAALLRTRASSAREPSRVHALAISPGKRRRRGVSEPRVLRRHAAERRAGRRGGVPAGERLTGGAKTKTSRGRALGASTGRDAVRGSRRARRARGTRIYTQPFYDAIVREARVRRRTIASEPALLRRFPRRFRVVVMEYKKSIVTFIRTSAWARLGRRRGPRGPRWRFSART